MSQGRVKKESNVLESRRKEHSALPELSKYLRNQKRLLDITTGNHRDWGGCDSRTRQSGRREEDWGRHLPPKCVGLSSNL